MLLAVQSLLSFKKADNLVVLVDSLSKRYSLCGARLGFLVTKNKKILSSVIRLAESRVAVATIEQYAASGLDKVSSGYFDQVNREYEKRRDILMSELSKIQGIKFNQPKGAFYLMVELPIDDAEKFCKFLLEDFNYNNQTVMLAPAGGFYISKKLGQKQVRMAYVLDQKDLVKACRILKKALLAYQLII